MSAANAVAPVKKMISMTLSDLSSAALKLVTNGSVTGAPSVSASSVFQEAGSTPIVFLAIRRPA